MDVPRRALALVLCVYLMLGPGAGRAMAALDAETTTSPMSSGKTSSGAGTPASGLESFKTDLATGSASFSVPIEVPPGTAGMQPSVALAYSSGAGNGWAGFGWTLDLGRISRRTQKGVPKYDTPNTDEFQLDSTRLVLGADNNYHTEIESFVRISYVTDQGKNQWEVTSKDGKRLYFGQTANSRIASGTKVFAWLLDRVEDTFGNYLTVTYQDAGDAPNRYPRTISYTYNGSGLVGGSSSERRVEFCLEGTTGDDCDPATLMTRPDAFTNYQSGFRVQTTRRLKSIRTYFGSSLVRRSNLTYLGPANGSARSRLASVQVEGSDGTKAPTMTFTYSPGATGYGSVQTWANPSDSGAGSHLFSMRTQTNSGDSLSTVIDLDGDGVVDRLTVSDDTNWKVWKAIPGGTGYATSSSNWPFRSGQEPSSPDDASNLRDYIDVGLRTEVMDLDGDGLSDRVTQNMDNDNSWNVYWNDRTQFTTQAPIPPATNGSPWPWPNPSFYDSGVDKKYNAIRHPASALNPSIICDVIDMDGDGRPDRVVRDTANDYNWKVYKNLGYPAGFSTAFSNWDNHAPDGEKTGLQVRNNNGSIADLLDLNGDGLPDRVIVEHSNRYWHVWFNTGSGFENVDRSWDNPSYLDDNSYESIRTIAGGDVRTEIEDINGDGLVDRITEGPTQSGVNKFKVYMNTGTGFSTSAILWTNPSSYLEPRQIQSNSVIADLVDVNGDGLADRVMYNGTQGQWQFFPYPSDKPDLLTKIENGLGGSVQITYQASTQYLKADGTRANNLLPFPVQTVKEVKRRDGVDDPILPGNASQEADQLTTYTYQNGAYDADSREFRGFGIVTAIEGLPPDSLTDPENPFPGDPIRTKIVTTFLQDDRLKGQVPQVDVSSLTLAGVETSLTQVVNAFLDPVNDAAAYATANEFGGANVQIALVKRTQASVFGPSKQATTAVSFKYDKYGNVKEQLEEGLVGSGTPPDERKTCTTYAPVASNVSYARAGFPIEVSITGGNFNCGTQTVSRTTFIYGQTGDVDGLWVTRKDWLHNPLGGADKDVVTNRTADSYGNIQTVQPVAGDGLNRTTTIYYDGEGTCLSDPLATNTHTFACRVVNALGHTTHSYYDAGRGVLLKEIDPNGHSTLTTIDTLGRTTRMSFQPSGGPVAVLKEYNYPAIPPVSGDPPPEGVWGTPSGSGAQNVRMIDYGTAPTNSERNYGIETRVYFDGLGRTTTLRTDGDDQKAVDTQTTYDSRGRVKTRWVPFFSGSGATAPGGTTFTYDALGRVTQVQHPKDNCTLSSYDGLDTAVELRQTCTYATVTQRRGTTRDAYGNVIEVREYHNPDDDTPETTTPYKTTYTYDSLDNLTEVRDACANDPALAGCTPSQTHLTTIQYDSLSRKIQASDPDMGEWFYTYDDVGNLKTQTDAKGDTITFTYDELDRVKLKDYSTAQIDVAFRYDGENDPGATNPIGRLTGVTDSAGILKYGYDARGNLVRFIRDYTSINKRFEYGYLYDNLNRLTAIAYPKKVSGSSSVSIGTLTIGYTDSANRQTPYVQEVLPDPSWPITDLVKQGTKYDAFGNLAEYSDGSSVKTTLTHDPVSGEMTENQAVPEAWGVAMFHQKYYYDEATRFIERIQNVGNELTDQYFVGSGNVPGYDALGRLRASHGPWLQLWPPPQAVNTYDPIGNILTKDVIAGSDAVSKQLSYTDATNPAAPHTVRKLNTVDNSLIRTYSYDPNGNMSTRITGATTRAFVWDQDNRLIRVTENGTTLRDFVYDYTGERVIAAAYNQGQTLYLPTRDFEWSSTHQQANVFVFLGSTRVAVVGLSFNPENIPVGGWAKFREFMDAAGSAAAGLWPILLMLLALGLLRWWIRPGRASVPVLTRRAGIGVLVVVFLNATERPARAIPPPYAGSINQILFYHADYKGSNSLIFSPNQQIVQGIDYWPFGAVRASLVNGNYLVDVRHKFTDQELENDLGLYYYGGRWYDPELGRFISPDPFVPQPLNPQSLNRYSYVVNNPINYIDPTGYFIGAIISAIIHIAVRAAINAAVRAGTEALKALITRDDVGKAAIRGAIEGGIDSVSNNIGASVGGGKGRAISFAGKIVSKATAEAATGGDSESIRLAALGGGVDALAAGAAMAHPQGVSSFEEEVSGGISANIGGLGRLAARLAPYLPAAYAVANNASRLNLRLPLARPTVSNPAAQRLVNSLFQRYDIISGGTAGAIRETARTGKLVGGSDHIIKGLQSVNRINNLVESGSLNYLDRLNLIIVRQDLQRALAEAAKGFQAPP